MSQIETVSPPPPWSPPLSLSKRLERLGRRFLLRLLVTLLAARPRKVVLGSEPRILVVRLDERLGNLIMLTPLLDSLRARFAGARLEVLVSRRHQALLATQPAVTAVLPFDKRALFAAHGPLATPFLLRRRGYDLALDAANPTDPSVTQAIIVRLAGARHTAGFASAGFGPMFSAPAQPPAGAVHEIDLRLGLLDVLPGSERLRLPRLGELPAAASGSPLDLLLRRLAGAPCVVINLGARLREKQLDAAAYARLVALVGEQGATACLTYGPGEAELARAVAERAPRAVLGPPTTVFELGNLMRAARGVISCDTGPMHLAVAVGTPTCAIFVATEPERYGYEAAPHAAVDARQAPLEAWLPAVERWLGGVLGARATA
jgi:heptosyltransferase III